MGVHPSSFTRFFDATVSAMVTQHQQAMLEHPAKPVVTLAEAAR
jgi:hypothetical protein